MLFKRAGASFETIVQSVVVDKIPCDSKPSKQMQLTFDGKLCKPYVLIEVNNCILLKLVVLNSMISIFIELKNIR